MDCRYFDSCSAPMCPKDSGVAKTAWFPSEEICKLKDVPEWVKRQRKIDKKAVGFEAGCFTLPMLERDCVIAKGIKGIDPDIPEKEMRNTEKSWLDKHSIKKEFSDEERAEFRDRIQGKKALA